MSNTTFNIGLQSICQQRLRKLLYVIPPTRYTPISPYPKYTQEQLNMRRKTEILKYNNPSQSNRFTKKELYAQIVNGRSPITNPTANTCNTDMIPTPSYACDVPGPITYFIRDKSIPLYQYSTNTASYAISNVENTNAWTIISEKDIFFSSEIKTKLFTLIISDFIDSPSYLFSFSTPIGLYLNSSTQSPQSISIPNLSYGITSISLSVLYNNNNVPFLSTPSITPIANIPIASFDIFVVPQSHTLGQSGNQYTLDVSFGTIKLNYYSGLLTFSNIGLPTQPGYIYDFYLTIATNDIAKQSNFYSTNFTTNYSGIYGNLSSSKLNTAQNVVVHNPNQPPYSPFTFSGNPQ